MIPPISGGGNPPTTPARPTPPVIGGVNLDFATQCQESELDPTKHYCWRLLATEAAHVNPEAEGAHVSPEAEGAHINPEAEGAHVNPEAEGAHVNPEAEGAHINPVERQIENRVLMQARAPT